MWSCVHCRQRSFVRGAVTYLEKGVFFVELCLKRSLYVEVCAISLKEFVCGFVCSVFRGV